MWSLAWHNLAQDKVRFGAALVGLVFSVVLMAVQASIFLGAVQSSSLLARKMDGDLWIVSNRTLNADFALALPARRSYQAMGVPGVARAGRLIVGFSVMRFPDGRQEPVIVVGPEGNAGWLPVPAELTHSRGERGGRGIVLDDRERYRFGLGRKLLTEGARAEVNGHRVFVAGFVRGMGSFAITPYMFTTYEAALDYTSLRAGQTVFVMVRCEPGADVEAVREELRRRIPDVEVLTKAEFAARSWRYWVMGTGMGFSLILMSSLALLVGLVIVGQTFLTSVRVKLREYAVLKALGFRNRFVAGVIVLQGVIIALLGYVLGVGGALAISELFGKGGTAVNMNMPPVMFIILLPLTLFICVSASIAGAWSVFRLAPAEVFR